MEGTAKSAIAIAAAYGLIRVSERAANIIGLIIIIMMLYTIVPPTIAFSTIDSLSIVPPTIVPPSIVPPTSVPPRFDYPMTEATTNMKWVKTCRSRQTPASRTL